MLRRIISIFAILMLLLSAIPCAQAESVQPRYSHIFSISAGIDLNGSSLWCFGQGDSKHHDTTTALFVRVLRQSHEGGSWARYASWSMTSSGFIPCTISETITVDAGYSYQVYVLIQIRDASGSVLESDYMYSRTISYPAN